MEATKVVPTIDEKFSDFKQCALQYRYSTVFKDSCIITTSLHEFRTVSHFLSKIIILSLIATNLPLVRFIHYAF